MADTVGGGELIIQELALCFDPRIIFPGAATKEKDEDAVIAAWRIFG